MFLAEPARTCGVLRRPPHRGRCGRSSASSSMPRTIATTAPRRGASASCDGPGGGLPTVDQRAGADGQGDLRPGTDGPGLAGVEMRVVATTAARPRRAPRREVDPRTRSVLRVHDVRPHRRASTTTDGSRPVTSAWSTAMDKLTITDRKKDVIIRKGDNVAPARSRTPSYRCRRSPRSRWSGNPTRRPASGRWRWCGAGAGEDGTDLEAVPFAPGHGRARPSKWPEEVRVVDFSGPLPGK